MTRDSPPATGRVHYAWIVAAVTFVVLLITAGVRATPGVFMVPLETAFGWSRTLVSGAIAINIALFGLIGPFAAALMDRWGLRRVILGALALLAASVALSTQMSSAWHLVLFWGVLVGAPGSRRWCSLPWSPPAGSRSGEASYSARSRPRMLPGSSCSCRFSRAS